MRLRDNLSTILRLQESELPTAKRLCCLDSCPSIERVNLCVFVYARDNLETTVPQLTVQEAAYIGAGRYERSQPPPRQ